MKKKKILVATILAGLAGVTAATAGDKMSPGANAAHEIKSAQVETNFTRRRKTDIPDPLKYDGLGSGIYAVTTAPQPIYFPKWQKFKGWQRENRRSTFNKHK